MLRRPPHPRRGPLYFWEQNPNRRLADSALPRRAEQGNLPNMVSIVPSIGEKGEELPALSRNDRIELRVTEQALRQRWAFSDEERARLKALLMRCAGEAKTVRDITSVVRCAGFLDELDRRRDRDEADGTRADDANRAGVLRRRSGHARGSPLPRRTGRSRRRRPGPPACFTLIVEPLSQVFTGQESQDKYRLHDRLSFRVPCFARGGDGVPVRAHCPHCITPCQVAEQHLGVPVKCHKCHQTFTVQPTVLAIKPPSTEPIPQTAGGLRLDIGGVTSVGRERSRNEDSFLVQHLTWSDLNENHQLALVIVADGMGGHAGGDQAARLALRTIGTILAPLLTGALSTEKREVTRAGLANSIDGAIKEANRVVQQAATTDRRYKGMGATAAVVVIWNGRVVIGHIGDCRVYLQHAVHLRQLTRDQTLVNRMVELGQLTAGEAAKHPDSNQVLQAIGTRRAIEPAHYKLKLFPGDWLLVACDGLHGQVDDRTIQETVSKAPPMAALLANRLVDLANQSGGVDNCTIVAVRCY